MELKVKKREWLTSRVVFLKPKDIFKFSDFEPVMIVVSIDDEKINFRRFDNCGKIETRGKNSRQIILVCNQEEETR